MTLDHLFSTDDVDDVHQGEKNEHPALDIHIRYMWPHVPSCSLSFPFFHMHQQQEQEIRLRTLVKITDSLQRKHFSLFTQCSLLHTHTHMHQRQAKTNSGFCKPKPGREKLAIVRRIDTHFEGREERSSKFRIRKVFVHLWERVDVGGRTGLITTL